MNRLISLIVDNFIYAIYEHKFKIIDIPVFSIFVTMAALTLAIPLKVLADTTRTIFESNMLKPILYIILSILLGSLIIISAVFIVLLVVMPVMTWYLNKNKRKDK